MGHDSLSPGIIKILQEQLGAERVHDPAQIVLVMDHVAPAATVGTANSQNLIRQFAREQGIRLFEVGRGICHQVLVEEQMARPGRLGQYDGLVYRFSQHSTRPGRTRTWFDAAKSDHPGISSFDLG